MLLSIDNSNYVSNNILCNEHIGKSIFFDEFRVGVVTEIWNTTNFYVTLFVQVTDMTKTCPLKCTSYYPWRIHLIINSKDLEEGYEGIIIVSFKGNMSEFNFLNYK